MFAISEMIGYGVATVCQIVLEVCAAIVKHLWKDSVSCHFPKDVDSFKDCMVEMESQWAVSVLLWGH